ncbi:hypothetical protein GCM10010911_01300 [Paenibacillus nasutitermitis]|uniref:Uncharacterized protein n=1 Tax=Paenibacillus nasutitermitis TaxID=1652958 RepID=A0A917DL33_9BACL|nr:hypothetical protein GCM10010911_01300 [Paenibacillus nasutitermitis]
MMKMGKNLLGLGEEESFPFVTKSTVRFNPWVATRMAEQILTEIGTDIKTQFLVLRIYTHGLDSYLDIMRLLYYCLLQ